MDVFTIQQTVRSLRENKKKQNPIGNGLGTRQRDECAVGIKGTGLAHGCGVSGVGGGDGCEE